ncbi:MAG: mercuric transporter MerT family protein [Planctomycetota bacterium]|nr:mercuric transporter MerT family protein [Planctomycetota bacterium]
MSGRGELIAKVGTIVSTIIASSCCWLPPILLVAGVSGAGMTAALEEYRPYFIVVTFSFLAAAFYMTYRPRKAAAGGVEGCCAPAAVSGRRFNMMTMNKIMLWAVTAMAVVFLFFPQVVTGLFASSNEITADMDQTVIKVIGMTCPG